MGYKWCSRINKRKMKYIPLRKNKTYLPLEKNPLFRVYWNVPFKTISTFELMELYTSFRALKSRMLKNRYNIPFQYIKWECAVKKELKQRETLTPYQKKILNKRK